MVHGMAGAAFVQLHHSWDYCLSPLDRMLERRQKSQKSESEVAK